MPNSPIAIRLRHSPGFAAECHGWCYLDPFSLGEDSLQWAVRLPKAGPRQVAIRWSDQSDTIRVGIPGKKIGETDRDFLRSKVRWMFRADEDFSEFWAYLGISPKTPQKEVERVMAKHYGHWGRFAYLAYKFERVFAKENYVDC